MAPSSERSLEHCPNHRKGEKPMNIDQLPDFIRLIRPSRPLPPPTASLKERLTWIVDHEHFPVSEDWALKLAYDLTDRYGPQSAPVYMLNLAHLARHYHRSFGAVLAGDLVTAIYHVPIEAAVRGIAEARRRGWVRRVGGAR
jgi:hypothetical protein